MDILPAEIWIHILSYCSRWTCRAVCADWQDLLDSRPIRVYESHLLGFLNMIGGFGHHSLYEFCRDMADGCATPAIRDLYRAGRIYENPVISIVAEKRLKQMGIWEIPALRDFYLEFIAYHHEPNILRKVASSYLSTDAGAARMQLLGVIYHCIFIRNSSDAIWEAILPDDSGYCPYSILIRDVVRNKEQHSKWKK